MWFAILLSVGAVAIGLFFGLRQGKVNNQLLDEGRIVKRKYVITEQAEEFTLRGADFARVLQGIQDADLRGSGVMIQIRHSSLPEATGRLKCIGRTMWATRTCGISISPIGKPTGVWCRSTSL